MKKLFISFSLLLSMTLLILSVSFYFEKEEYKQVIVNDMRDESALKSKFLYNSPKGDISFVFE
jgi:hypothetical protein